MQPVLSMRRASQGRRPGSLLPRGPWGSGKNPVQLLLCLPAPRTAFSFSSFLLQAFARLQVPHGSHWAKTKVSSRGPEGRIRAFAFFSFRGQPHTLAPSPIFKASGAGEPFSHASLRPPSSTFKDHWDYVGPSCIVSLLKVN